MKLTYFKLPHQTDSDCYSIRKKTKKAVIQELAEMLLEDKKTCSDHWETSYACDYDLNKGQHIFKICKIVIEYDDSFDLMDQLINGEDGAEWSELESEYTKSEILNKVQAVFQL